MVKRAAPDVRTIGPVRQPNAAGNTSHVNFLRIESPTVAHGPHLAKWLSWNAE
jgi:hypothetical protein